VVPGAGPRERAFAQPVVLPSPESSGIEHVVGLMMENRSFDHMLGWLEGADGRQKD
jgi:phospholipase C